MMKFKFLLLCFAALLTVPAYADQQRHQNKLSHLIEQLQISESQSHVFSEIMQSHHEKRNELRSTMQKQHKNMRESLLVELEPVLTPTQLESFKSLSMQHQKRGMKNQTRRGHCKSAPESNS